MQRRNSFGSTRAGGPIERWSARRNSSVSSAAHTPRPSSRASRATARSVRPCAAGVEGEVSEAARERPRVERATKQVGVDPRPLAVGRRVLFAD